jgi:hypothetical protein
VRGPVLWLGLFFYASIFVASMQLIDFSCVANFDPGGSSFFCRNRLPPYDPCIFFDINGLEVFGELNVGMDFA